MEKILMNNMQSKKPLFDALIDYGLNSNVTPFDVPGHKMGKGINKEFIDNVGENIFKLDINSMRELDNLSNPSGVIKEAEMIAADLFGADNAFFLVNGSTSGVQNMIMSAVNPGEKIILPRNIHKSAINGLILSGAIPVYIHPYIDKQVGISMGVNQLDVIRTIDDNLDAKALLILHPTYYGFTSNLQEIINYAHSKGIAVLVDESHGTHFYFSDEFPKESIRLGADMATLSIHKTGGSLTQSSILLHNNGLISRDKIRSVINIMQTSSASYLLLASLDIARYNLANNPSLFNEIIELSKYGRSEINKIDNLSCIDESSLNGNEAFEMDISKLIINVSKLGITGFEAYNILKKDYNIQLEVGESRIVLAIISLGDSYDSLNKLINALRDLANKYHPINPELVKCANISHPEVIMTPRKAFFLESTLIDLEDAVGSIAGDQIMIYPPGIPLVVPGELISEKIVEDFKFLLKYNNQVVGPIMKNGTIKIKVLKEGF